MNSATSTDTTAFQPWHFFTVATMLAATAAVLVARETSLTNLVLISIAVMSAGLVAIAVYRTLSPLARPEDARAGSVGGRTRLALEREKNLVLRSIKELEFDRAMGKIADADFHDMVARLRARAIGLLKQLDLQAPEWRVEVERELERRLAARRSVAAFTPAGPTARAAATTAASPACGTVNDADANFCKQCGDPMQQGSRSKAEE
jgi:hypothetical protein